MKKTGLLRSKQSNNNLHKNIFNSPVFQQLPKKIPSISRHQKLPHSIQLGCGLWFYPKWKLIKNNQLSIKTMQLVLDSFPLLKVVRNNKDNFSVEYHLGIQNYLTIPIEHSPKKRSYLLFTRKQKKNYYDCCTVSTSSMSVRKIR